MMVVFAQNAALLETFLVQTKIIHQDVKKVGSKIKSWIPIQKLRRLSSMPHNPEIFVQHRFLQGFNMKKSEQ